MRLSEVPPEGIHVLIVADRCFGDQKLYHLLKHELKFDYVIRFRHIHVTDAQGKTRVAAEWVGRPAPCAGCVRADRTTILWHGIVPCYQEGCERHKNSYSRRLDQLPARTGG
ncbi:MAG: hypothetical protein ACREV4_12995 [Gammaproteobacteria bacterium]